MYDNHEQYQYHFEPAGPDAENSYNAPQYTNSVPPNPPEQPKKNKTSLRVAALALSCALVGGAGGGALVYALGSSGEDAAPVMSQTDTTLTAPVDNQMNYADVYTTSSTKQKTPKVVYNENVNSVVGITTEGSTGYGNFTASGSGFIISSDGYIVTNQHVIDSASTIQVALFDGTTYDAKLVGSDASNDVALLKVEATGLDAVTIGDSSKLEVGDQVVAIGNPLGKLTFSLTAGYVSALSRTVNTEGIPINMLQTDVAINSGNSGGPLFDMDGNVVGITTAKYSGSSGSGASIEGIGFAIPINDVKSIVEDLRAYGYVTGQAYLGVSVRNLGLDATTAADYGLPMGVVVDSVTEGSCSEKAGVQKGDIITKLGDTTVQDYSELTVALKKFKAGESTTITVYRSGQTVDLNITFDEKQPQKADESQQEQSTQPKQEQQQMPNQHSNPFSDFFGFQW